MAERAAAWSRRRQGADHFPIEITRRRLYILPTRAGLGFSALLLVMGIAGLNYATVSRCLSLSSSAASCWWR